MRRIAVVGSGISGLAAAHALADVAKVTLYEAGGHFGGHTHTPWTFGWTASRTASTPASWSSTSARIRG
jgi:predicted NAD/FAD-binding protein